MVRNSRSSSSAQLRALFDQGTLTTLTDGQLLERFATDRGESSELAFAALIERHGPMVYRVCRGVLKLPQDSQDAFQATFFILIKKARGLWVRDSLGPWLHQVAYRTSLYARGARMRRHKFEQQAAIAERPSFDQPDRELLSHIHQAIDRLPGHFRAPIVLCELEGQTHEQAARSLGVPVGTIKSRLARGRERLRRRLERLGYAPNASLLAVALRAGPLASLPQGLIANTTAQALRWMTTRAVAGSSTLLLAHGVLQSMLLISGLQAALVFVGLSVAASGVAVVAIGRPVAREAVVVQSAAARQDDAKAKTDDNSTIEVKPGKLDITLTERGTLRGVGSTATSEIEGQTTILALLSEGKHVKKGYMVAELDSARLRDDLTNQEIATKRAEADLEQAAKTLEVARLAVSEYLEGAYKQEERALVAEMKAAEGRVTSIKSRIERTRNALSRLNELIEKKADLMASEIVAKLDLENRLDDEEAKLEALNPELAMAQSRLDVLTRYTRAKSEAQLKLAVEKADSDVRAKRAAFELEKSKLEKLRRQIDKCKLTAWEDGMVVYANDGKRPGQPMIEEGAVVRERQPIFSIVNFKKMQVLAKVREAWIDRVAPEQKVRIRIDALPNQTLEGRVRTVAPVPDPAAEGARKLYTTIIDIDSPPNMLRPGMTAETTIMIDELDHVIAVPLPAVQSTVLGNFVIVKDVDGAYEWREVQLGRSNDREIEVKSGLKPGERVARSFALLSAKEKAQLGPLQREPGPELRR